MSMTRRREKFKRLVASAGHGRSFMRKLPSDLGGCRFPASLEGGTKYLRRDLHRVDPTLTGFARRYVTPGSVVWDIGANVGLFTFVAAGLAGPEGSVLAVEADTWLVGNLRRAAMRNSGVAAVSVLPVAVSDTVGVAEFIIANATRATNYLRDSGGSSMTGGVRERQLVPTLTLDSLLERFGVPSVIKIDIEGGEPAALRGAAATLSHRPTLFLEVYDRASDAVHEILAPHRYTYLDASTLEQVDRPTYNVVAIAS